LPVKRAAEKFKVNPVDIFMELGKRRVVGGQEDMVVEVAMELAKQQVKE
jgi:4-hydroxy 2-oxovalerate aldolase